MVGASRWSVGRAGRVSWAERRRACMKVDAVQAVAETRYPSGVYGYRGLELHGEWFGQVCLGHSATAVRAALSTAGPTSLTPCPSGTAQC